jgi:putative phosphoesterase
VGSVQIALISDIHANAPALDAVLSAVEGLGADQIVCLGDVAGTGPHPVATLRRIGDLSCPVVMGNCDWFLLDPSITGDTDDVRRWQEIDSWCADQLSEGDRDYIRSFQSTLSIDLDGITMLCYHGSPSSFDDIIDINTSDHELDRLLGGGDGVFAGGHTHVQMHRERERMVILNPGSVGLAYDYGPTGGEVRCAPWAEFAVVTQDGDGLDVAFHRVGYEAQAVVDAILESDMPNAEWLAGGWAPSER